MKKLVQNLIACFVIFFCLFGIILQTKPVQNFVKTHLISLIERETGYQAKINEITLLPTLEIAIDRLQITNGSRTLATIHEMHMSFFPTSFCADQFYFYSVEMDKIECGEMTFRVDNTSGKLNLSDNSIHIQGCVYPKNRGLEYKIDTDFFLKNAEGTISLKNGDDAQLSLAFSSGSDQSAHINNLHVSLTNFFSLEGQLSLDSKGNILDSMLFLTTEELSQQLHIKGYLYGEGKVLGSIWSPEIAFSLFSDELKIGENILRKVEAKLVSQQTVKGLTGQLRLSLTKDDLPYLFTGNLFWDEPLSPLPTRLESEIPLERLKELLDIETTPFSGKLNLLFSLKDGVFSTEIRLKEGTFENYELGQTITQIEALLEGNFETWMLKEVQASDGYQGHFTGNGKLSLNRKERFPFELNLILDQVQILHLDNLQASVSGPLNIKGNLDRTEITGTLNADEASFQIPEQRKEDDENLHVIYINQNPEEPPPSPIDFEKIEIPLTLALEVTIPDTGKILNNSLSSNWGGTLKIAGKPHALMVTGELNIAKGTYKLRGRQLQIHRGAIHFGGDLDKQITLYVIGTLYADRYTIEVIVKGSTEDPQITFRSNPPLSRREILSWLLFNKDLKEISEFQGDRLDRSILSLSSAPDDGPDLLTRLGDAIGIDRIDITGDQEDRNVSFELGKYVSENTYVSISRKSRRLGDATRIKDGNYEDDHQDPSNRIGIETYLNRYFKLQAEIDEDQTGQINIIWKRDY